jgi:hypothetical protein
MEAREQADVDVTIRIDKGASARLEQIVSALEASGLTRLDVHERFLIVNGSAAPGTLDKLRKVEGVASVREDRKYRTQI